MSERTIGELLRSHRLKAELKQQELADIIGYDRSHISRVERNIRKPKSEYLEDFIQGLKLPDEDREEIWRVYKGGETTSTLADRPLIFPSQPNQVKYFRGRDDEIDQIIDELYPGNVVGLYGPAGFGKTSLAIEIILTLASGNELINRFPDGIFWHEFYIESEVDTALEKLIHHFGEKPEPSLYAAAQRVLANKQLLLVLDGTEYTHRLDTLIKIKGQSGIVITSIHRDDVIFYDKVHDIDSLNDDESVKLLQDWSGLHTEDKDALHDICELVGWWPFAIRLAGQQITCRKLTASEFLKNLETSPLKTLNRKERRKESVPLLLKQNISYVSQDAQEALGVTALLTMTPFTKEAVAAGLEIAAYEASLYLGELVNYSILERDAHWRYKLTHRLVQTYVKENHLPPPEAAERLSAYYVKQAGEQTALLDADKAHIFAIFLERILQRFIEHYVPDVILTLAIRDLLIDQQPNEDEYQDYINVYKKLCQVEQRHEYFLHAVTRGQAILDWLRREGSSLRNQESRDSFIRQIEELMQYMENFYYERENTSSN